MDNIDPMAIMIRFNECINNRDVHGLSELMTKDHVFIDSSDAIHGGGKEVVISEWRDFFTMYPDYHNHFSEMIAKDEMVIAYGYSTCSFKPLDGPAIWTARVENGLIAEWRVYLDTPENRKKVGL